MNVVLKGYCPVQDKKDYVISAKQFSDHPKHIGKVECQYLKDLGNCTEQQCPIVKENGYFQI